MSEKLIHIPDVGDVTLRKRSGNKTIRLSVTTRGVVVSLPTWTPYLVASQFAHANKDWIARNLAKLPKKRLYQNDQKIGKLHRLTFEKVPSSQKPSTRVTSTKIIIKHHPGEQIEGVDTQDRAEKAVIRALKKEVEQLIPPRLGKYAAFHGFSYKSVSAKQLKRRWGSCDSHKNIIFNCFLMELPWECIDYVIIHELTHTEHMNHGDGFWRRLTEVMPRAKDIRRQMRQYQPIIQADDDET